MYDVSRFEECEIHLNVSLDTPICKGMGNVVQMRFNLKSIDVVTVCRCVFA